MAHKENPVRIQTEGAGSGPFYLRGGIEKEDLEFLGCGS
jgi:hypothetical protein